MLRFLQKLPLDSWVMRCGQLLILVFLAQTPAYAQGSPDRDALVNFYNTFNGDGWTDKTNWLSASPVNEWFGVRADFATQQLRVTDIRLNGNNLTGIMPESFGAGVFPELRVLDLGANSISGAITAAVGTVKLPSLTTLRLSGNQFSANTGLSANDAFSSLALENNNLGFEHLEPLAGANFPVTYSPQADIGTGGSIALDPGDTLTLNQSFGGSRNSYEWTLDGQTIPGATSEFYTAGSVTAAQAGEYVLFVQNSLVPGLTLSSSPFDVTVDSAPEFTVTPTFLGYSSIIVGSTGVLSATIENTGGGSFQFISSSVTGTHASDFSITAGGTASTFAGGSTRAITVEFAPGAGGLRSASLIITTDAPGSPHTIPLSGTGLEPALGVTPTALAFGDVELGSSSAQATLTVQNTEDATLVISSITLGGAGAADYTIVSGGATPLSLGSAGLASIVLQFTPTATGLRSAEVVIASNAPGSPASFQLSGTGTAPALAATPTAVDFGAVEVGSTSNQSSVIVSNTGTAPLVLTGISISGDQAADFSIVGGATPFTINPSSQLAIALTFEPGTTGSRGAALALTSNAPGSPFLVALSGTGIAPALGVTPGVIAFGSVEVGSPATATATLENTGTAPLVISSFAVGGNQASDFVITAGGAPITLAVGQQLALSVEFTPGASGVRSATLTVTSNDAAGPLTLPLSGTGTL
ncbi:MAG: hypothetical protein ACI84D_000850, partial [Thalassolituus oleivorans]